MKKQKNFSPAKANYSLTTLMLLALIGVFSSPTFAQEGVTIDNAVINVPSGMFFGTGGDITMQNGGGQIDNAGTVELKGNWNQNATSGGLSSSNGTVLLDGAAQTIGGSVSTTFRILTLGGTGIKSLSIATSVATTLNLADRELAAAANALNVTSSAAAAITRTTGYISNLSGGYLARTTNAGTTYLFPVGGPSGGLFRPLEITPATVTSNTFKVRFAAANPNSIIGASSNGSICSVNTAFYHEVTPTTNEAALMTMYFSSAVDGNLTRMAHWQGTPVWTNMSATTATTGYGLPDALQKSAWTDFTYPYFALAIPLTPSAPVASAATAITCGGTSFTANWAASTDAINYFLDVSTTPAFSSNLSGYNNLSVGNVTTLSVTGLTAGTTYYYRVRAQNGCGTSASSNIITAFTSTATPPALTTAQTAVGIINIDYDGYINTGKKKCLYFVNTATPMVTTPFPDPADMGSTNLTIPGSAIVANKGLTYSYVVNNTNLPPCGAYYSLDMNTLNSSAPDLGVSTYGPSGSAYTNSFTSFGTAKTVSGAGNTILQITGNTKVGYYTTGGGATNYNTTNLPTRVTITISGGVGTGWSLVGTKYQFPVTGTFAVNVLYEADASGYTTGFLYDNNTDMAGCPYMTCPSIGSSSYAANSWYPIKYLFNSMHSLNAGPAYTANTALLATYGSVYMAFNPTFTAIASPTTPTVSVVNNCGSSTLTASNYSGTLTWSTAETTPSITTSSAGTYSVTQNSGGCNSAAGSGVAAPITVPGAITAVNTAGPYCASTTLTATGGANGTIYYQSTTSGNQITNAGGASVTVSNTGTHYFRAYNNGCWGAENSAAITINPTTIPGSITGGTSPICIGANTGTMTLGSNNGSVIKWQKQLNSTSGIWTDIASTLTTFSEVPSSVGTWYYRPVVKSGVCAEDYPTPKAIQVDAAVVSAGTITAPPAAACVGDVITYTVTGISGGTFTKFQDRWNSTGSFVDLSASNPYNWTATTAGSTHNVQAIISNGACTATTGSVSTVIDNTAPTTGVTVSSTSWVCNDVNTYTITATSTETGVGIGGSEGISVMINNQGTHAGSYGGYFTWHPSSYIRGTAAGNDNVVATGSGGGVVSKDINFGGSAVTLVSCVSTISGNVRTIVFTVRPKTGYPAYCDNSISMKATDVCNNTLGWVSSAVVLQTLVPPVITTGVGSAGAAGVTNIDYSGYINDGKKNCTYFTGTGNPVTVVYPTTPFPDVADMGHTGGITYTYNATPPACGSFFAIDKSTFNSNNPSVGVSLKGPSGTAYTIGASMSSTVTTSGNSIILTGTTTTTYVNNTGGNTTSPINYRVTITKGGSVGAWGTSGNLVQCQITGNFTMNVLIEGRIADWANADCNNNSEQGYCPYQTCNSDPNCGSTSTSPYIWVPINKLFNSMHSQNFNYALDAVWGSVYETINPTWIVSPSPTITVQPVAPANVCSGTASQTITVTAVGNGLTYDWKRNGVSVSNGTVGSTVIAGQGTNSLTLTNPVAGTNDGSYTVVVGGICNPSVTSNPVTVSLNTSPAITTQPTAPTAVCSATGSQTVSVVATGTGLTYSWRRNGTTVTNGTVGATVISGQGSASLTITNPVNGVNDGSYDVVIGGTCTPGVTSNAVTFTIYTAPVITVQPTAPAEVCSGLGTQIINVTATGTGLNYSWRKNGTPVTNTGIYSGQGTSQLTLTNPLTTDAGSYDVIVSGTCTPSQTSNAVTVTVNTIPSGPTVNGGTGTVPVSVCGSGTVTAVQGANADNCRWYSSVPPSGYLSTSTSYGPISASTTLYVTSYNSVTHCESSTYVRVDVNYTAPFTVSPSFTNPNCYNGADGTATLAISGGGTPPFTFTWSQGTVQPGVTGSYPISQSISGLGQGLYTVNVADAGNCSNSASFSLVQPSQVTVTTALLSSSTSGGFNINCNGGTGSINLSSVSGGTPGYTYLWSNGNTTNNPTGLVAGSYTVTVKDSRLCAISQSYTLTQPSLLTATITPQYQCSNGGVYVNAVFTGNPSGGVGPYTYLWSSAETTQSTTNAIANGATRSVTVTDANGCTASATYSAVYPANGSSNNCGSIYVDPNGDGSTGALGSKDCPTTLTQAVSIFSVDPTRNVIIMKGGTYTVTTTVSVPSGVTIDGGYELFGSNNDWRKSSAQTTTINIDAPLTTQTISSVLVGNYIGMNAAGTNNFTLKDLTINVKAGGLSGTATGSTSNRGNSVYAIYLNGATNYNIVRCKINAGAGSAGSDGTTPAGTGGAGNAFGGGGGGGTGYDCSNGNGGATGQGTCPGGGGSRGTNNGCNIFGCDAHGGNGSGGGNASCAGSSPAGFTAGAYPTALAVTGQFYLPAGQSSAGPVGGGGSGGGGGGGAAVGTCCLGGCGSGDADGGAGGAGGAGGSGGLGGWGGGGSFGIFVWGGSGGNILDCETATSQSVGGNGAGGQAGGSGQFGAPGHSRSQAGTTYYGGSGGKGSDGGTGGRGQDGARGLAQNVVSLNSAVYTATGTTVPNPQTTTVLNFKGCANSVITIGATSPNWVLPAGAVYVNDVSAAVPATGSSSTSANIYFPNGTTIGKFDLAVGSGSANNYRSFVTLRDNNRTLPSITLTSNTICPNGTENINTSYAADAYLWAVQQISSPYTANSPGANLLSNTTAQNPGSINLSTPGNYQVKLQVKDECCGWSIPVYQTITVEGPPANPTAPTGTSPVCAGTTQTYSTTTTSGAVSYNWIISSGSITTPATGLSTSATLPTSGTSVIVSVQAANGCGQVSSFIGTTISLYSLPVPTISTAATTICAGNSITLTGGATGGATIPNGNYVWSPGGAINGSTNNQIVSTNALFSNTTFNLAVTDVNGCTGSGTQLITVNALPVPVGISNTGPYCVGNTISVSAGATGGSGTYSYGWSSSAGGSWTATGTPATRSGATTAMSGAYNVTITDGNNCSVSGSTNVTVNVLPVATFTTAPGATTCSGAVVTYATQSGQTNYIWSVPGVDGVDYSITSGGLGTSDYTVSLKWLSTSLGTKTVTVNYTSSNACAGTTPASNTTNVILSPSPTFTAFLPPTVCSGVPVFYSTQNSSGQTNFVWSVPGTNGVDYTITAGGIGTSNNAVTLKWLTAGTKTVTVNYTGSNGCQGEFPASNTIEVFSSPVPTFTAAPGANVCINTPTVYTTQSGQPTYTWNIPGTDGVDYNLTAGGITTNSVTLEWITPGGQTVTVNYENADGCVGLNPATNTTTVNTQPSVTNPTPTPQVVCNGNVTTVSVTASGGIGTYSYQWYSNTVDTTTGGTVVGTSTASYQPVSIAGTTYYYCVVTGVGSGCAAVVTAQTASVTFTTAVTGTVVVDECMYLASSDMYYVLVTGSGGTPPYTYPGAFYTSTSDQGVHELQAGNSATYAVVDAVGCSGSALPLNITAPASHPTTVVMSNSSGNVTVNCWENDFNKWVTFRAANSNPALPGDAMLAINDNHNNLGLVTVDVYKDGSAPMVWANQTGPGQTVYNCTWTQTTAMRRHFKVTTSVAPANWGTANPVEVMLFFTDQEYQDLKADAWNNNIPYPNPGYACSQLDDVYSFSGANGLYVTKYTAPSGQMATENGDYLDNLVSGIYKLYSQNAAPASPQYLQAGQFDVNNPNTTGFRSIYGGSETSHYVQMKVTEFSEFWIHGSQQSEALPVEMIFLQADAINNTFIRVTWATAVEINNSGFEVQRSVDGQTWSDIGWVAGHNNATTQNDYSFNDNNVTANVVYYYRLKQVDNDGAFVFTDIVSARITGETNFSISDFVPNPTADKSSFVITATKDQEITVSFYNVVGQKLMDNVYPLNKGVNKLDFDLAKFANGTYTAIVSSSNEVYTKKVVLTK